MKYFSYTIGVLLMVLTAVFIISERTAIRGTSDVFAPPSSAETTQFRMICRGANVFKAPSALEADATADLDANGDFILTLNGAGIDVTGAVAGGDDPITADAFGISSVGGKEGWGYVIFPSPRMVHIYSCQGSAATGATLEWQYSTSDNADLDVGWATSDTTDDSSFTLVSGTYASVGSLVEFPTNSPRIMYDDDHTVFLMRSDMGPDQAADNTETEDVDIRSAPDA